MNGKGALMRSGNDVADMGIWRQVIINSDTKVANIRHNFWKIDTIYTNINVKKTCQFKTWCKGDKSSIENSTDHFC